MEDAERTARNQLFQQLKPTCVKLSQLALKDDGSSESSKALRDTTNDLLNILDKHCRGKPSFDDKLADYVFFPLSHVLRLCQKHPVRLAELATKCIRILLECGWKIISIELAQQLLLLLTVFAGGAPSTLRQSEELQTEAYGALAALFKLLLKTPQGSASLIEESTIPALGQCLTIILDGITDGPSSETQYEALLALKSLWLCIKDQQTLSNFLPGTISALTKCLMPSIKAPRSRKVLVNGLDVLQIVLINVLGDIQTRNMKDDGDETGSVKTGKLLTKSWLRATSSKVKLALANIVKLRTHKQDEVRSALERTCLVLLDECHDSLAESGSLLVETAMALARSGEENHPFSRQTSLQDLATIHTSIADLIKGTIYNWVTSLPRVMQSNNEHSKQSAMLQLSKAHEVVAGLGIDSGVLDEAIGDSLRNSIICLLEQSRSSTTSNNASIDDATDGTLVFTGQQALLKRYRPLIMPQESEVETRNAFNKLILSMRADTQLKMANEMLEYLRNTSGNGLLSAFWLSLQLLKSAQKQDSEFDAFMSPAFTLSDERESIAAELYSYSISVLGNPEGDLDWRVQAVALEVVAHTAKEAGESFRPDLVDTIYPIVQLLGSDKRSLREHAIATLNMVSDSCGYHSTSELIVANVDYLVNAISLKLNTFDISPQAPQVLVMMIRLSGSSLLPYLDDVVGSIFAALDNFHGYPRLVDSLFSVLGEIVDESGRSGQLQLAAGPETAHSKKQKTVIKVDDIVALLQAHKAKTDARELPPSQDFPRQPWKDAEALLEHAEKAKRGEDEEEQSESEPGNEVGEVQKQPPTKVYTMVQKITRLGQYYLTSQSPVLRRRLLDLISTACKGLSKNEDEFLPLVNDIWPVLIKRLYDEESFVVISATHSVSELCRRAGDFLSTRIQVEWNELMKIAKQHRRKAEAAKKGRHGRGEFSQNSQVWEAFIQLLLTIVEYVRIDDIMFDELLELLGDLLDSREDVRETLSILNEDAVWLKQFSQSGNVDIKLPILEGYTFANPNDI